MKVVIAPDKFAGTMTASDAAAAIACGWSRERPDDELLIVPMADGGDGLLDVVSTALACHRHTVTVTGPRGEPVSATWLLLSDGRAVIEAAEAIGLRLVAPQERDPMCTSSRGLGELMAAAAASGCRQIVVGLGGSATVDGGAGLASALGGTLEDASGAHLTPLPPSLLDLVRATAITTALPPVTAAVDVDNPLLGRAGAATMFGPQKGARPADIEVLESALRRFADVVERDLPEGPWRERPGAGAAGGVGFSLMAFAGATVVSGAAAVADLVGLAPAVAAADIVVTGEGSLDQQTLRGKAPDQVRRVAREAGVPVAAVAGRAEPAAAAGFDTVVELGTKGLTKPVELTEERAADVARTVAAWARPTR